MSRIAITLVTFASVTLLLVSSVAAQKQTKPWTEWSRKDAEKMLSESPWSRMQVGTDTSEMFYAPTSNARNAPNDGSRTEQGATNEETNVKYGIRFFSARPVRQAFARVMELQNKLDAAATERLHNFAEIESPLSIIVAVTFESPDKRSLGKVMQAFNSAGANTLKNNTYLERRDGKRLFLEEYVPPGPDGFGARFIFLRKVDGMPFIAADTGEIRFFSEYGTNLKLNMRFKVSEMMYNGKLEY